jgi:hypothetical protein
MNNSDMPAMAIASGIQNAGDEFTIRGPRGLTKREHFAGLAMQGFISQCRNDGDKVCVTLAVGYADALLKALETSHE